MKIYLISLSLFFACFSLQSQECITGNCYDGFGRIIYNNGQEYIGEFKNGEAHGYGQTFYIIGDDYLGEYNQGKKHGYGIFTWSNGNKYIGKFKDGKQDGYAVKTENVYNNLLEEFNVRILACEWKDGALIKRSIKETDKSTIGCLFGKCGNLDREDAIYFSNKTIRVGNVNQAIEFSKDMSDFYIGEFRDNKQFGKGVTELGFLDEYSGRTVNELEFTDKKNGAWNSYYVKSFLTKREIFIKNWIEDKMIEKIEINHVSTKISAPPSLIVHNIEFNDFNSNNLLEANEKATISFDLKNTGEGSAYDINIQIEDNNNVQGLTYDISKQINVLKPQSVTSISIPISTSMKLATSTSAFKITISEGNGFDLDPIELSISTQSFIPPNIEIVDFVFLSDVGQMKLGEKVNLQFVLQNMGQGVAEEIEIKMFIPDNVFAADKTNYSIHKLNPGERKIYDFSFFTNKRFSYDELDITAKISEKYNKYASDKTMSVKMEQDISNAITLKVKSDVKFENITIDRFSLTSHIDENIPTNSKVNNRFALVIGNEDYTSHQMGLKIEQNVDYAINDAKVFKNYALKTLGVKEENLIFLQDATSGKMSRELSRIIKLTELEKEDAELIIYYAGHGFPDELTKIPYLIPVDISGGDLSRAINLHDLYLKLGDLQAKKVTVFLDACFTGGGRESGLIASRGIKVKPKEGALSGNLVVFSASSEEQSSLPFKNEKHGIFTYHLLNKLQQTNGKISYGALYDSIKLEVNKTSLRNQGMEQDPKVNTSSTIFNDWRNWRF